MSLRPPAQFFHGEMDFWKMCGLIQPNLSNSNPNSVGWGTMRLHFFRRQFLHGKGGLKIQNFLTFLNSLSTKSKNCLGFSQCFGGWSRRCVLIQPPSVLKQHPEALPYWVNKKQPSPNIRVNVIERINMQTILIRCIEAIRPITGVHININPRCIYKISWDMNC